LAVFVPTGAHELAMAESKVQVQDSGARDIEKKKEYSIENNQNRW